MALITCAQIQADLDNYFTQGNPAVAYEPNGLTKFLLSPMNTQGVLQSQIDSKSGKYRAVELIYTPQYLESEIATVTAKTCTSTNEKGQLSTTYQITAGQGVLVNEKFDIGNMAAMCKDNPMWFAERINAMIRGLVNKMSTVVATESVALTGAFAVGDANQDGTEILLDQKVISTKRADGTIDPDGYQEIKFSATNANYPSIPFVFGFGDIYKYMQKVNFGCCTNDGLSLGDFVAQNELIFMADKKVQTALGGANEFLTAAAGALQIITYNEFLGEFNQVNDESYKQGVIQDPETGLLFDIQIKNDCGTVYVNIKLDFKTVGLPDDMFAVGDPMAGVTYVNKYTITNP